MSHLFTLVNMCGSLIIHFSFSHDFFPLVFFVVIVKINHSFSKEIVSLCPRLLHLPPPVLSWPIWLLYEGDDKI